MGSLFSELAVYQKNKDDLPYKLNFNDHLQFLRKAGKRVKDNQNRFARKEEFNVFS